MYHLFNTRWLGGSKPLSKNKFLQRLLIYTSVVNYAMPVNPSVEVDLDRLHDIAQQIPDDVWFIILDKIRNVLDDKWFNDDQSDLDELITAMDNGNEQKAARLIKNSENQEEIEQTIHSMCQDVLECEAKDRETIQSSLSNYE